MRPALLLAASLTLGAGSASAGSALFDAHGCRSCHRVGEFGGSAGPDLTLVGHRRPRAWLERWLASPRALKADTTMPEQGLAASDRAALAGWLASLRGEAWGGRRPWDGLSGADAGRVVYDRAGCVACHGPGGRGGHPNRGAHGDVIPALKPLLGTYTRDELKARLRAGVVPETHGAPAEVSMPGWKEILTEPELDALADYLLSLAASGPKDDW